MNYYPLITVIINCYNGEKFLNKCIDSILNQSYKNFEIIFWNNKSDDSSLTIVKQYNDKRIKIFNSKTHTNLSTARNEAIKKASGEYICFLDVDDYWNKKKLERQIQSFKDKEVGLSFTNFWYVKKYKTTNEKKKINLQFENGFTNKIIKKYEIVLSSIMFKKNILKKTKGIFNDRYHVIGDFDLTLKLSLITKFNHQKEHLTFRSWHGKNESIKKRENAVWEIEDWLKENEKNFDNYQNEINFLKNRIFYDKLNFLIKKKKLIKAIIFFLKSNIIFKFNYVKHIFLWFFNQIILGKPKNDHS